MTRRRYPPPRRQRVPEGAWVVVCILAGAGWLAWVGWLAAGAAAHRAGWAHGPAALRLLVALGVLAMATLGVLAVAAGVGSARHTRHGEQEATSHDHQEATGHDHN